jgi:hypothetical protein
MIAFVTMFKNLGRDKWEFYKRSSIMYLNCFKQLAENIDYTLVVYVETDMLKEIINNVKLKNNIILIDSSTISTYLNKYIESESQIMASETYKSKIPEQRKKCPEHTLPQYTLTTHSKIQYIYNTKKIMPGYDYYAWIDFGWVRNNAIETIPRNLDLNKLGNKIIINNLNVIPKIHLSAETMLSRNEIFIAGNSYIVPNHQLEVFQHLYDKKIEEWKHLGIADDEQNLIYQLWSENKEMFQLIHTGIDNWWALYRDHLNGMPEK